MDDAKTTGLAVESPFYRVTAKALVFDEQRRLLLINNRHGQWELPGGGWEHDESFEECLEREFVEELGTRLVGVGDVAFMYRGFNPRRGFMTLRIAAPAAMASGGTFQLGDDIMETRFVARDEFMSIDLQTAEGDVQRYVDRIWST